MIGHVVSVGARCPLGLSRAQVALSLRAQKGEPRALPFKDGQGHEISMCFMGGLPAELCGYHRMLSLATPALVEAFDGAKEAIAALSDAKTQVPLILALPEKDRPDNDERFDDGEILSELARRTGLPLDIEGSSVIRRGHAGFAYALADAEKAFKSGATTVIVGGVDSYFHPQVLTWLDDEYRLHSPTSENGFIPGEAAAFLVLAKTNAGHASVICAQAGEDETVLDDEQASIGEKLSELVESAQASAGEADWVINDTNNERHRQTEFDLTCIRQIDHEATRDDWAAVTGDLGAASGALFAAVVTTYWELDCAPSDTAFITLSSEGPERGVVALKRRHDPTN